jgi:hypothetical protein
MIRSRGCRSRAGLDHLRVARVLVRLSIGLLDYLHRASGDCKNPGLPGVIRGYGPGRSFGVVRQWPAYTDEGHVLRGFGAAGLSVGGLIASAIIISHPPARSFGGLAAIGLGSSWHLRVCTKVYSPRLTDLGTASRGFGR